jgi:hypothetical protein
VPATERTPGSRQAQVDGEQAKVEAHLIPRGSFEGKDDDVLRWFIVVAMLVDPAACWLLLGATVARLGRKALC